MQNSLAIKILGALCCGSLCATFAGCWSKPYTGNARFAVSGKVTVDGKPMEHGQISFVPQGEEARVSGGEITAGAYSIPEEKGPNAATYRVEIRWNVPTGKKLLNIDTKEPIGEEYKEGLPAKYHKDSTLTVEVAKDKTAFDFELESAGEQPVRVRARSPKQHSY